MRVIAVLFNLLLVPGVGHVAIGRWRRGLPWIGLTLLWPLLALLNVPAMFAAVFAARIGSAIEVALLEKRAAPTSVRALAIYGGGLVAGIVWVSLVQMFAVEAFKIPSGAMIPTLQIGDHVFANKLAYRFGEPARGDVAVFVNPCKPDTDFVKRIVGLPGDTIEVRCDVLYVNGKAAPSNALMGDCKYWDRVEAGGEWVEETCVTYVEQLDGRQYELVYHPVRRERDQLRKVAGSERGYHEVLGDRDFPEVKLPRCPVGGASTPPPVGRIEGSPPPAKPDACAPRSHYVVPDGHVFVMGDNRENSSDSRSWGPVPIGNLKGRVISIWWAHQRDEVAWSRIGDLE